MADSKAKKDTEKGKVFDVAKPSSQVAAEPTSRPIIVGHESTITKDPMMAPDEKAETVPEAEPAAPIEKKRELKLEPTKQANNLKDDQKSETEKEDSEVADQEKKSDQTPTTDKSSSAAGAADSSDAAAVDALADSVSIKREQEEALEKEEKKHQETEKLITSKKYFVKTKTPSGKRNARWLVVLLILLVAGAVWYLLLGPGKELWVKEEPIPAAVPVSVGQVTAEKPPEIPALKELFDPGLGISFKYPNEWGEAKITDNSETTTEKGKRILIEFSKNTGITAGMKSKDWSDSSKDINVDCKQPGFIAFVQQKTQKDNGMTILAEKPDYQVYEELTGGLCNDLQIIANKKFIRNKVYSGLQIWHQSKVEDKLDLAKRIEDYNKQPDKYFSKQLRDQMTAAIESAKEL